MRIAETLRHMATVLTSIQKEYALRNDLLKGKARVVRGYPRLLRSLLEVEDYLAPLQTPTEQALYRYLFRWSFLEHKTNILRTSKRKIAEAMAASASSRKSIMNLGTVRRVLKALETKGHIKVLGRGHWGVFIQVLLPREIPQCKKFIKEAEKERIKPPPGRLSQKQRLAIFRRDKYRCHYCGLKLTSRTATIDHITPLSKGGDDSPQNLVTSCMKCNAIKANKIIRPGRMKKAKKKKS